MNFNNKFPLIKWSLSSVMILTFITSILIIVLNVNEFTAFSSINIRNISFYFIISFICNLIFLSLLNLILVPLYKKYKTPLISTLIIAAPFIVVIIPHVLVWVAYTPIDSNMLMLGKVFFYLSIIFVLSLFIVLLIFTTKVYRLIFGTARIIGRSLLLSSAAYAGLFLILLLTIIMAPNGISKGKALRPNIVLVVVDGLRKDFLGAYGFPLNITPCIDNLARTGILFESAFTSAPSSVPGHASILFGEEIEEHKALNNSYVISEKKESIARILKKRGYNTYGLCSNPLISASSGFSQGFDFYWSWGKNFVSNAPIIYYFSLLPFSQIIMVILEMDLTNTYAKLLSKKDNQPFLLFLQYMYCHKPYIDRSKPRWINRDRLENIRDLIKSGKFPNNTSWSYQIAVQILSKYAASVYYNDSVIRKVIHDLERKKLLENTVIILTADHGENLIDHGEKHAQQHVSYFNTSLQIPMILWSQRLEQKGLRISRITSQAKIMDVILDIVSDESIIFSAESNSDDIRNLMCKKEHFAFAGEAFVLFNNSFKYITNIPGQNKLRKLFPWREDFYDRNNIYNKNELLADEMHRRLSEILALNDFTGTLFDKKKLTKEQIRNLKALGYIK